MIPTNTTTIDIQRVTAGRPYEAQTLTTVATDIRATISSPTGLERRTGGSAERVDAVLTCDPVDIRNADTITDADTGTSWRVVWTETRRGLGLDHETAGLVHTTGVA